MSGVLYRPSRDRAAPLGTPRPGVPQGVPVGQDPDDQEDTPALMGLIDYTDPETP